MNARFDPASRYIIVDADVDGVHGSAAIKLVVDTGSTRTIIRPDALQEVGYDASSSTGQVRVNGVSGSALPSFVELDRLLVLGIERQEFEVVCHPVPLGMQAHGLLGLDFLRDHVLTIDMIGGQITLK